MGKEALSLKGSPSKIEKKRLFFGVGSLVVILVILVFSAFIAVTKENPVVGKWEWSYDSEDFGVSGSVSYAFTKEKYFFYESKTSMKGHDMSMQVSGTYKTENGYLELDGEVARFFMDGKPGQAETPKKSVDVFKYQVSDNGLELSSDNHTLRLEKKK